jgi:ABC-type uncharacterized transport system permease subunit
MGDLIHKLPTDEILMNSDEKEGLVLLFGQKDKDAPMTADIPEHITIDKQTALAHEIFLLLLFICLFFLVSLRFIDGLLENYIPFCKNLWIMRNFIKAIIFAIILWVILNRTHIMTTMKN